jgi:hypothetical protein
MPILTRCRTDNPHQETCHVYYGDVLLVGSIGERAGVPKDLAQWGWHCGFYPGLEVGQHSQGVAESFEAARAGFEADWNRLLPAVSPSAFDDYRSWQAHQAELRDKRGRGEKLDSELPLSVMTCVCGVRFDSFNPEQSYAHRLHIYAAQSRPPRRSGPARRNNE